MNQHVTSIEIDIDLLEELQAAVVVGDAARLDALFQRLSLSEALRELLELSADDRRSVLTLVSPDIAADLIEEAPHEIGADLMEDLEIDRAVEIMDELDSDVQADLIGDMESEEAEAILGKMDAEEAADVRRLSEYEDDTAGGLMMSEVFECADTMTVSDVIKVLAKDGDDVDRYRGQHPYIIDEAGKLVGVVSLWGLLATKRSALLTTIMVEPMTVQTNTTLSDLGDLFDKYDFLGVPVVSDMSGWSGNQAVGVSMREFSLGLVRPKDAFKVWLKEISVGVINGVALGILIAIVAWIWKGSPALGLVIGGALALNTMLAVSIGGVVPLLLKRIGQDPAVASGPLLTTVTDMAGFFFVLSLATLMMPWLV